MVRHATLLCGLLFALLYFVSGSASFRLPGAGVAVLSRLGNLSQQKGTSLAGLRSARLPVILRGKSQNNVEELSTLMKSTTNKIIAANVLVFLATCAVPSLRNTLMKVDHRIARGESYRLLSSLFAHGGLSHLAMNCYSLSNVGPQAEKIFGPSKFLGIYVGSGVLANAVTALMGTAPYSLGASGCTFGLLGAMGAYYYMNKDVLGSRSDAVLSGIKRNLLMNAFYGLSRPNVDHWAHAAGFGAGAGLAYLVSPRLEGIRWRRPSPGRW